MPKEYFKLLSSRIEMKTENSQIVISIVLMEIVPKCDTKIKTGKIA